MNKMRKDIQEELQKDEVAETLQRIADNIQAYRSLLISMAIIIVAAVLITLSMRARRENNARQTNQMMMTVMQSYQGLIGQPDAKQREDLLKNLVDNANKLADSYPDTKLGREALYIKGNAYYQMDKFAEAEKAYSAYLDKATNDEEKARGEIALGYSYENQSFLAPEKDRRAKLDTAMTHYTAAAKLAGDKENPAYPYLYYYAVICQARLNELIPGKTEEAKALYKEVLSRPAPVEKSNDKESQGDQQDVLMQFVRRQINEVASQMSLQATAKMRLERLESAPLAAPSATTEVKVVATPAATPVMTPAATAKPTATPTVKPTATATPVATVKPMATPAATATPAVTAKPTATPAATATPVMTPAATAKPTATPSVNPTATATPAATVKPAATPSATATPTVTPATTPASAQAVTSASKPAVKP